MALFHGWIASSEVIVFKRDIYGFGPLPAEEWDAVIGFFHRGPTLQTWTINLFVCSSTEEIVMALLWKPLSWWRGVGFAHIYVDSTCRIRHLWGIMRNPSMFWCEVASEPLTAAKVGPNIDTCRNRALAPYTAFYYLETEEPEEPGAVFLQPCFGA